MTSHELQMALQVADSSAIISTSCTIQRISEKFYVQLSIVTSLNLNSKILKSKRKRN